MENVFNILKDKMIKVPIPARDRYGKIINGKETYIYGKCNFLGYGIWGLQVVVNNTPVPIQNLSQIELIE